GMALDLPQFLASLHVPEMRDPVLPGGEDARTVRGKGHRQDRAVGLEVLDRLACLHVPKLRRLVIAARQDGLAIGRESYAANLLGVAGKLADFLARLDIPQAGRLIGA